MPHTVVILKPNQIPKFIANVTHLRPYKNNPHAVIDPKVLPTEPVKYWKKDKKHSKKIDILSKQTDKDAIDQLIAEKRQNE